MRVVVISPHRDDAAFSLGLSVDHWLAAGHSVQVVNCFTKSDYAPFSDVDSLHGNDRVSFASAVRRREDIAWSKLLKGKFSMQDLEMMDAPLRLGCSADEVCSIAVRAGDRALARVAGSLEKFARTAASEALAIAVPLAVGDHIDHRIVHQAALTVFQKAAGPFAFYEDLPYSAREGSEQEPQSRAAATGLSLTEDFAMSSVADESRSVDRKKHIAECYDSQVDSSDVNRIAEFCRNFGGRERVWANALWRDTPLSSVGVDSE